MKKIGIALGGGGARGLAHIGVLRVLRENNIPLQCIAGTSMGAIIGACYAVDPDIDLLADKVRAVMAGPLFSAIRLNILKERKEKDRPTVIGKAQTFIKNGYFHLVEETQCSLFDLRKLEGIVASLLPDIDISETKLPFACVATDLTYGVEKIFTRGSLRACVLASSAIPGIFPPVKIGPIYYNDGGAVSVTPIRAARALGAGFVIASDVKSRIATWEKPEKAKEIISRCNYITGVLLNEVHLKEADAVVSPAVKHMHWSDFDRLDFMVREGEKAAAAKILEIKAKTSYRTLVDKLKDVFRSAPAEG